MKFHSFPINQPAATLAAAIGCVLLLSACGGEQAAQNSNTAAGDIATGSTTFSLQLPAGAQAAPTYHLAPVLLEEPSDIDTTDANASAYRTVHRQVLPSALQGVLTRQLTLPVLRALSERTDAASVVPSAPVTPSVVTTYTPAQIRAAYGLPSLAAGPKAGAAQPSQLGAGQTIYLIDAYSDPNVVAELAAFNSRFGLPTCAVQSISVNSSLPLAPAPTSGCTFSVVNSSSGGIMTTLAPAYDSGWATEIALDVQWAHATAPMARIILINAPDPGVSSLAAAATLANDLGPGIVSMSFGAMEGSWISAYSPDFSASGMTYFASTGDDGTAVNWPAVDPGVVAVGGTSLTYSGSGSRSETVWSDTGGGISQFTSVPAYQTSAVPGVGTLTYRSVPDVAFNADPYTGEYLAVMSPGSSAVSWLSAGGTSISSPQWAGIVADANSMRAAASKTALGDPHSLLYQIGAAPASYAGDFYDVTIGSDGSCATCSATIGYDQETGLGTPNGATLLAALVANGVAVTPPAPVVVPATINGQASVALSFQVSASGPDALTYSLSGAPAGMTIAAGGAVAWSKPVAGTYNITATAKDSKTGLSGSAVYTILIAAPPAPAVTSASITGVAGTALSYTVAVTNANPFTLTLSGAPSGMTINNSGLVSWAKPVAGTYNVTVTAKDSKTSVMGQGTLTVTISAPAGGGSGSGGTTAGSSGPKITTTALSGKAGMPLSGSITVTDPGVTSINVTFSNAPLGMTFTPNLPTVAIRWPSAVAGSYTMTVTATDSNGHSAQASIPISVISK